MIDCACDCDCCYDYVADAVVAGAVVAGAVVVGAADDVYCDADNDYCCSCS